MRKLNKKRSDAAGSLSLVSELCLRSCFGSFPFLHCLLYIHLRDDRIALKYATSSPAADLHNDAFRDTGAAKIASGSTAQIVEEKPRHTGRPGQPRGGSPLAEPSHITALSQHCQALVHLPTGHGACAAGHNTAECIGEACFAGHRPVLLKSVKKCCSKRVSCTDRIHDPN